MDRDGRRMEEYREVRGIIRERDNGRTIRYRTLGEERATLLRRVRAWKRHAEGLAWDARPENEPRWYHILMAHATLLDNRGDTIPEREAINVITWGMSAPSDDHALELPDEFPEPVILAAEERDRAAREAVSDVNNIIRTRNRSHGD